MEKYKKEFDERHILTILPKISQWESIPYAPDLTCQECGKMHRYITLSNDSPKARIIGWCETDYGYQLVFECPHCFSKFRYHPQDKKFDIDDFVDRIMYDYVGNIYFSNGMELEHKWDAYELKYKNN